MKSRCMIGKMKREYDGRCHITEQQIERMRELRAQGVRIVDISELLGVSYYSVWFYTTDRIKKKYVHKKSQRDTSMLTYYKRKALWEAGIPFIEEEEVTE